LIIFSAFLGLHLTEQQDTTLILHAIERVKLGTGQGDQF